METEVERLNVEIDKQLTPSGSSEVSSSSKSKSKEVEDLKQQKTNSDKIKRLDADLKIAQTQIETMK